MRFVTGWEATARKQSEMQGFPLRMKFYQVGDEDSLGVQSKHTFFHLFPSHFPHLLHIFFYLFPHY